MPLTRCLVFLPLLLSSFLLKPRELYTLRERVGVGVASAFAGVPGFPGRLSDFADVEALGFGWYSDWTMNESPERPADIEFAQLLATQSWPPRWEDVERTVQANPGSLWIIGNEPETRGQGQHTPEQYADRYHDAYHFIKALDPSAQIAIGGVVQPTPLRLRWLDLCLDYYAETYGERMPVDVWNIHVQILREKRGDWGCGIPFGLPDDEGRLYEIRDNCNVDIFEELVRDFCAWLKERGERHKPLIISEFGVLMPSSYLPHGDQSVLDFMTGTFDFLLTARDPELGCAADGWRLVQRWLWFSLNFPSYDETPGGFNGALYDWRNPEELTPFGRAFRDYHAGLRVEETTLTATLDTSVISAAPLRPLANDGRIRISASGGALGFLWFDLSALPPDALILEAELSLHAVSRTNRQGLRLLVGPASAPWDASLTYLDLLGSGLRRQEPSVPLQVYAEGSRAACDVTPIVRAWSRGALAQNGFILDGVGAGNGGYVTYGFASSEWRGGSEPGPELRIAYLTRAE